MQQGRTKKAVTNIAYNMMNQIITLVLAFVSRTVFIRVFGVEYLGLNGLFTDVLGLLSMADLGFNTAMVYSFYKPLAENDHDKMAALTTFYRKVYIVIAAAVTLIGISIIPFLPMIVNTEQEIPQLNIYYLFALANVVCSYLCIYKTSIITADQKNYIIARVSMIITFLKTCAQIIIILVFKNYIAYLAVGVAFVIVNNVIVSAKATRLYPFINQKVPLKAEERKDIFSKIGSVFLYKVSSVLLSTTDNILISVIVSTAAVGYYSNYLLLQNKLSMIYAVFFTSLTASIGNLIVQGIAKKQYEVFQCTQTFSFMIGGIIVPGYIVLINDLISIWLGSSYILPNLVVYIIGLNFYLGCVLQPIWAYREATGLYQKTKWIMVICAVLNIVLSVILGLVMGIAGILLASVVSRLLTYIWYEPKLLFEEYFKENVRKYYAKVMGNFLLIVALVIINKYIAGYILADSWITWFVKACVIGMLSLLLTVAFYWKSQGVQLLKNRLIKK